MVKFQMIIILLLFFYLQSCVVGRSISVLREDIDDPLQKRQILPGARIAEDEDNNSGNVNKLDMFPLLNMEMLNNSNSENILSYMNADTFSAVDMDHKDFGIKHQNNFDPLMSVNDNNISGNKPQYIPNSMKIRSLSNDKRMSPKAPAKKQTDDNFIPNVLKEKKVKSNLDEILDTPIKYATPNFRPYEELLPDKKPTLSLAERMYKTNPNQDIVDWENSKTDIDPMKLIARTFGLDVPRDVKNLGSFKFPPVKTVPLIPVVKLKEEPAHLENSGRKIQLASSPEGGADANDVFQLNNDQGVDEQAKDQAADVAKHVENVVSPAPAADHQMDKKSVEEENQYEDVEVRPRRAENKTNLDQLLQSLHNILEFIA